MAAVIPPTVTPTAISRTGITDLAGAAVAATAQDAFINTGKEFVVVFNNSGSPVTVTMAYGTGGTQDGQTIPPHTLIVPAGKIGICGPFPRKFYNDSSNNMNLLYSAFANVNIFVGQINADQ